MNPSSEGGTSPSPGWGGNSLLCRGTCFSLGLGGHSLLCGFGGDSLLCRAAGGGGKHSPPPTTPVSSKCVQGLQSADVKKQSHRAAKMSPEANLPFTAQTSQRKTRQRYCGGRVPHRRQRQKHGEAVMSHTQPAPICSAPKSRSQNHGRQRSRGGTCADGRVSAFLCAALWRLCVCAGRRGHRCVTLRPQRGTT